MSKAPFQIDDSDGPRVTRAWVLHPDIRSNADRRDPVPALAEAVSLARALPALEVAGADIVPLRKVDAGKLFGKGKIEELRHLRSLESLCNIKGPRERIRIASALRE